MKKEILYDDLLKQIPNKYILTIVGGQRAREIGKGAELLTKCSKKDTVIKKVFREVADGKISYMEAEKQSGEQVEEQ